MIDVGKNYYFEFTDKNLNEYNFLGNEFLSGNLKHKALETLFPSNKITFFPLIPTRLDQSLTIQNLQKENFFKNFEHILIDWPMAFSPHLSKIIPSFPTPLCLTNKRTFEAGVFERQDKSILGQVKTDPIFFIESYNARRHIAHNFGIKNITCVGGVADCLQLNLLEQNHPSPFTLANALFPWLSAQFLLASSEEIDEKDPQERGHFHNNNYTVCKNILQFILHNSRLKILIAVDFKVLCTLNSILEKITSKDDLEKFIEDKIISLKQHQHKQELLYLSQPSKGSCLEYSQLNGFISRQLFEDSLSLQKTENWLENCQLYFTRLFRHTAKKYLEWTKMNVNASEQRDFFRFAYRLAIEKRHNFPSTFDLLLSAKSVINSNFAYEMHKELQEFPAHPQYENAFKQIELPLDSFFDKTQKISLQKFATIQSQKPSRKTKIHSVHKNRPIKTTEAVSEEKYADNTWVYEDHPYSCSFPNEDIFMEKLAFDVKKNVQEKVKAKEQLHRELQSDFCDGLDLKETIRNWHKDKIIVKETLNVGKADIGAVVFGFAQQDDDERFSWRSFWLAEQHDDSHLMFYATPFKDNLIGPGIAKSEFGGFAVIPLDSYIEHPWNHPYILNHAQNCTECLILAGALSSAHRSVLFISHHPPSQHIMKILKQSGKNIIYARLDEFSQTDIRRVRTFHILAEAGVRDYAQKYIRKD